MQLVTAASSGGDGGTPEPALWKSEPRLGVHAIVSPVGPSTACATFVLEQVFDGLAGDPQRLVTAPSETVREVILAADAAWQRVVSTSKDLRGLGAAFAMIVLRSDGVTVAHLGDCRVCQVRGARLVRRTHDHVQDAISTIQGKRCRVVTRGFAMSSNPEVVGWSCEPNDVFVLTSEVHDRISDEQMVETVAAARDAGAAASRLVALAAAAGGADWITALVAHVT